MLKENKNQIVIQTYGTDHHNQLKMIDQITSRHSLTVNESWRSCPLPWKTSDELLKVVRFGPRKHRVLLASMKTRRHRDGSDDNYITHRSLRQVGIGVLESEESRGPTVTHRLSSHPPPESLSTSSIVPNISDTTAMLAKSFPEGDKDARKVSRVPLTNLEGEGKISRVAVEDMNLDMGKENTLTERMPLLQQ